MKKIFNSFFIFIQALTLPMLKLPCALHFTGYVHKMCSHANDRVAATIPTLLGASRLQQPLSRPKVNQKVSKNNRKKKQNQITCFKMWAWHSGCLPASDKDTTNKRVKQNDNYIINAQRT